MIAFVLLAFVGGFLTGAVSMALVAASPKAADRRAMRRHSEARAALSRRMLV